MPGSGGSTAHDRGASWYDADSVRHASEPSHDAAHRTEHTTFQDRSVTPRGTGDRGDCRCRHAHHYGPSGEWDSEQNKQCEWYAGFENEARDWYFTIEQQKTAKNVTSLLLLL